ncbi:MAG: DegQ family serine endoprotease [Gammaproteobacteria bacterium]|nr:DegQ family serine endoprotease [Gammaproteobacteria bacterium]
MTRLHRLPLFAFFLSALLLAAGTAAAALPPADSQNQPLPTLAPMLEQVTPAVVNIATRGKVAIQNNPLLNDPFFRRFFGIPDQPRERDSQSLGSGVIVDAKRGYILTNHHVIANADEITVTLRDRRSLQAKVIGTDPEADVAVIQIQADRLTALPLADSSKLRVGDFVVAIGNPFGLGQTVTSGIVSALGRTGLGIEGYEDFIQTDASINPGNSGGALVNLRGELVGLNTAILAPGGGNIGIGFAIPTNMSSNIMAQLIEFGKVRRGRLGIQVQDLTPELAQAFNLAPGAALQGAVVSQVTPGSAADKAGVKAGDIITTVNGQPARDGGMLRNAIGLLRVGEKVQLDVLREGKTRRIEVVVKEDSQQARVGAPHEDARLAGVVFGAVDENSPMFGKLDGIPVVDVDPSSRAAQAGLRPGDMVLSINRKPVRTPDDLVSVTQKNPGPLLFNVRRDGAALFIVIR